MSVNHAAAPIRHSSSFQHRRPAGTLASLAVSLPEQGGKVSELESILSQRIQEAGGWIGFDAFMQCALYEPGLGYYESARAFGAGGDFVTAVDMGPWLALGLADMIVWGWQQMGAPSDWCLLEQGGGSGRLLCDVVQLLRASDIQMPGRVVEVEASATMRNRQQQAFSGAGIDVELVASLREASSQQYCLMFCNELPDAFPVRCFSWRKGQMYERGVCRIRQGFEWQSAHEPLLVPPAINPELQSAWSDGYISEWSPHLASWQLDIASVIQQGYVFCVDYGYAQSEFYRPQRVEGTLMAHRRHQGSGDVLRKPGSRDITAHVDFTALAKAGISAGLQLVSFMGQGGWLAQSPRVQQRIQQLAICRDEESVRLLAHAKRMLLPFGMGELFKLCIQACGLPNDAPPYLTRFDRESSLGL